MSFQEFLVSAPAVIAIVKWLKDTGMPSRWARLAAPLIGVILALVYALAIYANNLAVLDWQILVWKCAEGFFYGIGSSGVYDAAKYFKTSTDALETGGAPTLTGRHTAV